MTWLVAPIRQVARGSLLNCSCLLLDRLCCCPRGPCSYGRTRHSAIHGQLAHTAARVMTPSGPCSYCRTRHTASYGQLAHTAARVIRPLAAKLPMLQRASRPLLSSLIRPHVSFGHPRPTRSYGRTRHDPLWSLLIWPHASSIALPVLAIRKWPGRLGGAQPLHTPLARPGVCCIALSLPQVRPTYW